ncbi:hypothetical protein [Roseomonas sp. AR75]|jgi:hypothetical protein|uniref:hypothetical protein n=1 Tax=Roseomonas sp. AR75 TaxID=2562311 RepID=UPI0010C10C03|nr:hypothetical protein [Roseomonas sp. AR75]
MIRRFALFAALGLTVVAAPALAQQRPAQPRQPQMSETERLNQLSLERARAGQNALQGGPDTTQNLNRISEEAAQRGQNMGGQAPMPFR